MAKLYPLTFDPIFKEKIWGGQKLKEKLGKDFSPLNNCGESWEISGVKGDISVVSSGELKGEDLRSLIERYQGDLLGQRVYQKFGNEFPLLIKFLDANEDLSIQVHPDDEMARQRHDSFGKTEMWYIIDADPGSTLITGFNQALDKETYLNKFNAGELTDILNQEPAEDDDVFFIPAGRVHTIGKGLMLAEIQQTSDITYRIYDFDRPDANGNLRELHVEQAVDAIDYKHYDEYKTIYDKKAPGATDLVSSPYFQTNRLILDSATERNHKEKDTFVIYICLEGSAVLGTSSGDIELKKGSSCLVPASIADVKIIPNGMTKLLETWVP